VPDSGRQRCEIGDRPALVSKRSGPAQRVNLGGSQGVQSVSVRPQQLSGPG
jgi:hypothetical protein